ncbi:hypothetical protein T265_03878 [Opisthorchis viverrini]|uniref:Uncharacterized protein n=1 Tax=Opisthorchis viverrini TaxID=6198 RepID=A0A074ZQ00_OPIVI|nr:hypothetical protein T265_03878 [Opisthorchis viverrini]KER29503.1 hypothetical protein T265_03878 [Opisthorchis viverrini]
MKMVMINFPSDLISQVKLLRSRKLESLSFQQHYLYQFYTDMKEITKRLGAVGATRLPGWGPRDPHCAWLETLQDMAANRCQWRSCCQLLFRLYGSEASVLNTDVMLSMMMMMMIPILLLRVPLKRQIVRN